MKKILAALLAASALVGGAASAATYTYVMNNSANQYSTLAGSGSTTAVWSTTLTVNDTVGSNSTLVGSITSGGFQYNINMNLMNAYKTGQTWTNGSTIYWQYFTGTLTRGATVYNLSDVGGGGSAFNAMDARVGINGGPYNSITDKFELGFWAGSNADINVLLTCSSPGVATKPDGSCGGSVPLPGSLTLLGIGLAGLGLRLHRKRT